jgi:fatty-acyl-CoA synthase
METMTTTVRSIADRQALLQERFSPWVPRTLDGLLRENAAAFPERPFVLTDERTWTYRQIDAWVDRMAAGLRDAQVAAGEHVAVVLANHVEFVIAKFAISRVGAVMVPINTMNKAEELGFVLRQSDAVLLITMDQFRGLNYLEALDQLAPGWAAGGGGEHLPALRRVVVFSTGEVALREGVFLFGDLEGTRLDFEPPNPSGLSDIIFTSGTTGSPKGVMLTHDMMLRTAYGSAYGRAFDDGWRILFSLPMYHVFGYVEGLLAVLFVAGAIIPQLRFTADETLAGIERHGATDVLMVPTMTLAVLDAQRRTPRLLPTLHSVLSSGGKAPTYLWDELRTLLGVHEITTGYGMTECTASTTVTRPDDPVERLLTTNGRLRDNGIAGFGEPHNRLAHYRVVDPVTNEDVPSGEVGELIAKGPGVTAGYYRNEAATAAAFTADGWLHTGDLGRIDAQGYLTLVGRLKESYRCGGETVMPGDAEDALILHPTVLHAHVVPIPDARMGEVGVAFVCPRPGAVIDTRVLQAYCHERLARYKVPKYFLEIAPRDVPVTASGRARKFMLTALAMTILGQAEVSR